VRGDGRGRGIGVPTANLAGVPHLVPGEGVYACLTQVDGETEAYAAAVNVGPQPTFGQTAARVEAHVIGMDRDLYGSVMGLSFVARLRGQVKFDDIAALKLQLARDVDASRREIAMARDRFGPLAALPALANDA
jgi:riboflavin kinase/FMN adenylyltransferase